MFQVRECPKLRGEVGTWLNQAGSPAQLTYTYSRMPNKSGGKMCRIKAVFGHICSKQVIVVGA